VTKILVLNHDSEFLPELLEFLESRGIETVLKRPMDEIGEDFDGAIASGGFLKKESAKAAMQWYREFLGRLERPFLGICLGLRILGIANGARARKISLKKGLCNVSFSKEFPLLQGKQRISAFRSHEFELIPELPESLENFAMCEDCAVQALKVNGRLQFAVQFHPEKRGTEANEILENFLKLCESGKKSSKESQILPHSAFKSSKQPLIFCKAEG